VSRVDIDMHHKSAVAVAMVIGALALGCSTPRSQQRVAGAAPPCSSSKLQPSGGEVVPNSFIVVLEQSQRPPAEVTELATTLAAKYQVSLSSVYDQLGMFAIEADEQRACRLSLDSRVASVSRDHIASID
jgi:hypothetical protein